MEREEGIYRVRAASQVLDIYVPGWYQAIDLPTLKLSDGACCVMGQLCKVYGVHRWSQLLPDPEALGVVSSACWWLEQATPVERLNIYLNPWARNYDNFYNVLEPIWRDVIVEKRLSQPDAQVMEMAI